MEIPSLFHLAVLPCTCEWTKKTSFGQTKTTDLLMLIGFFQTSSRKSHEDWIATVLLLVYQNYLIVS